MVWVRARAMVGRVMVWVRARARARRVKVWVRARAGLEGSRSGLGLG